MVEFALIVPMLLLLLMGTVDLARVYMTMLSVESAAREAADYGTFGSQRWNPAVVDLVPDGTVAQMQHRACVAASKLPDYAGPDTGCANPRFSYQLSTDRGATWAAYDPGAGCDDAIREPPCYLKVTLEYDFRLLVPLHIEAFGSSYGLPTSITFERSSVFAMTDLERAP